MAATRVPSIGKQTVGGEGAGSEWVELKACAMRVSVFCVNVQMMSCELAVHLHRVRFDVGRGR